MLSTVVCVKTLACLLIAQGIVSQQWCPLWVVLVVGFNGCLKMKE